MYNKFTYLYNYILFRIISISFIVLYYQIVNRKFHKFNVHVPSFLTRSFLLFNITFSSFLLEIRVDTQKVGFSIEQFDLLCVSKFVCSVLLGEWKRSTGIIIRLKYSFHDIDYLFLYWICDRIFFYFLDSPKIFKYNHSP